MKKSIYEEAYLILNSRIADGEVKSFKVTGTTYCKINNALKQARKQDKLLELYKKLYNGCTDYHDYDELKEIQKQIKELEK